MFIAALFTIAKLWKQPRCPTLMNGLGKCSIYIHWSYYSAIKKNEIMLFAGKWMELEMIMLSKVSQDQKHKGHVFLLEAHMSKKRKPLKKK
jgi:hypothetical protein